MKDKKYGEIVKLAEHYKAIGETDIYLYDFDNRENVIQFPWEFATDVEASGSYRLNGPCGVRFSGLHPCGLKFRWTIDFEERSANGSGINQFDVERLRAVMDLLPEEARKKFAKFMKTEVLSGVKKITEELRESILIQTKSEDIVWELVAYGELKKNV